jgi:hypothetical protein
MNLRRWLTPGIGIKRWLLVVFAGLLLLAGAFAHYQRCLLYTNPSPRDS